eukprot:7466334-Alexandrium_andersonii.AAC.1
MPSHPQAAVENLSPRDLAKAFAATPRNSGGADGRSPSEPAYAPLCASSTASSWGSGGGQPPWPRGFRPPWPRPPTTAPTRWTAGALPF